MLSPYSTVSRSIEDDRDRERRQKPFRPSRRLFRLTWYCSAVDQTPSPVNFGAKFLTVFKRAQVLEKYLSMYTVVLAVSETF